MRFGTLFEITFIICFEVLIYVFLFLLAPNCDAESGGGLRYGDTRGVTTEVITHPLVLPINF